MANEWKRLARDLERAGWRVKKIKSGWMALSPDGVNKVTIHGTPGDHRSMQNALARLRKGGYDPDA